MKTLALLVSLVSLSACATSPSGVVAFTTPAITIPVGSYGSVSASANLSYTPTSTSINSYTTQFLPSLTK